MAAIDYMRPLPGELIIDEDFKDNDALYRFAPDGYQRGRGFDPDTINLAAVRTFGDPPGEADLIDPSEYDARLKEMEEQKSGLTYVREFGMYGKRIPALDQGQVGYCWAHSVTMAEMLMRAWRNFPYVALSAYSVAATIKKGVDEGGWCGLSAKFGRDKGFFPQSIWPQGDRNYSKYNTPENWAIAHQFRTTEDWVDLTKEVYDQNLTQRQIATFLMTGVPCALDFEWWGHSVCAISWVMVEPGSYGIRILNSWGEAWGENGTSVIRGSKMNPMGAIAVRSGNPYKLAA